MNFDLMLLTVSAIVCVISEALIVASSTSVSVVFESALLISLEKLQLPQSILQEATSLRANSAFYTTYLSEVQRLQRNYSSNRSLHEVAACRTASGQLVGYVDLDRRTSAEPYAPYLSELVVHPSFRKQGIGKTLVQHCLHIAKNKWAETRPVSLWVDFNNKPAVSLYRSLGFKVIQKGANKVETQKGLLDAGDYGTVLLQRYP